MIERMTYKRESSLSTTTLLQIPSPTQVEGWSDSIERGGIIFVLVLVIMGMGFVLYRNMKATEKRIEDLERRNEALIIRNENLAQDFANAATRMEQIPRRVNR